MEGNRLTGWQTVDGETRYFLEDGSMYTQDGFITIDGENYYFFDLRPVRWWLYADVEEDVFNWDTMQYEKQTVTKAFYFGDDGKMKRGWQTIDGRLYYFESDGSRYTPRDGACQINGEEYYFVDNSPLTGLQVINGKTYLFSERGVLLNRIGDVNDDQQVNEKDLLALARYLAKEIDPKTGEVRSINAEAADVNRDGKVDGLDVVRMMKFFAGEIASLLQQEE